MGHAMDLHGGHQFSIMHLDSHDPVRLNELTPNGIHCRLVGQNRKNAFEQFESLIGFLKR